MQAEQTVVMTEPQAATPGVDAPAAADAGGTGSGGIAAFGDLVIGFLPWVFGFAVLIVAMLVVNYVLLVRPTLEARARTRRRGVMLAVTIAAVIIAVLTLPVEQSGKVAILQLLGLAVTALITLSSTTIAANFMAGLMIGRVRSFNSGDFIDVNGNTGRVTDRGMFHVEIQTEERDLITLPNSFMITNPVRVVRTSGTIVHCAVSLGYDVPRTRIEARLKEAAETAGLADPYVQIRELGDFSVTYRVCGFLEDVKVLISTRTRLRAAVLDALHHDRIEIVSPTFMNQRQTPEPAIPERDRSSTDADANDASPESIVFDKADDAVRIERVRKAIDEAKQRIKDLEGKDDETGEMTKAERKAEIDHQKTLIEYLTGRINRMESDGEDGGTR
ncbi:MAG: mechanosensitive ion channel family protein [Planctomycetota bacterium]